MQSSRSQMFFKISDLKNFADFWLISGLKARNFIKKGLQHRCFPVKFAKSLRTPFFREQLRWLLLEMERRFIVFPFFITMI